MTTPPFDTDRRWQQLRKLTEVSRALTYTVSLDEVLRLTVERAVELLEADKAVLMLTNDDGLLSVRMHHGLDPAVCAHFREPMQETLATRLTGLFGAVEPDRFLAVPLVMGGEVTGLLAVMGRWPAERADEEEWLLSALADQAAVALEKTRLDESVEQRERLIGVVSHDLRNPIAAIALATEVLLRRSQLDEATLKTVQRMRTSAARASRMIADLLDFTQARLGGGIPVDPKPADLNGIVRQVVDEIAQAHPTRRIRVHYDGSGMGTWDPDRLAQVVSNVVTNAVHYSPPDTDVRVETAGTSAGFLLRVRNEGPPIPAEQLPHVFEPLLRARSDVSPEGRSIGLGLYIVKKIVEAHGGTVSVESTVGSGTVFSVFLPRQS